MFIKYIKKFLTFFALNNFDCNKLLLPGLENSPNKSGSFKYKNRVEECNS